MRRMARPRRNTRQPRCKAPYRRHGRATQIERSYAVAEQVGPLVRRVLARNPSPFTYTGTQTYLVAPAATWR
jgi:hypothetical protein